MSRIFPEKKKTSRFTDKAIHFFLSFRDNRKYIQNSLLLPIAHNERQIMNYIRTLFFFLCKEETKNHFFKSVLLADRKLDNNMTNSIFYSLL